MHAVGSGRGGGGGLSTRGGTLREYTLHEQAIRMTASVTIQTAASWFGYDIGGKVFEGEKRGDLGAT